MKIELQKQLPVALKGYELIIQTMEGDADDFHQIEYNFDIDKLEELRELIIACEVLKKSYPYGRGGSDEYQGEYWDKLSDDWPRENSTYSIADSFDKWHVVYHDGLGGKFPCKITLDEEALEEIKRAPRQEI